MQQIIPIQAERGVEVGMRLLIGVEEVVDVIEVDRPYLIGREADVLLRGDGANDLRQRIGVRKRPAVPVLIGLRHVVELREHGFSPGADQRRHRHQFAVGEAAHYFLFTRRGSVAPVS